MNSETDGSLPKLLIVDDSRMVRASIIKHIRGRFSCREEVDGEAGWEALLVDPDVELVLTDLGMPKLDGFGLLDRIRSSGLARVRSLPVVVISGDEDEAAREKARALGATDFITKGISTPELLARLDSLNTLGRARRELEEARAEQARQQQEAEEARAEQARLHQEALERERAEAEAELKRQQEALKAAEERPTIQDPETGLPSTAYMATHGAQEVSNARRHQGEISAMVVEIDDFDDISSRHGAHVSQLVTRKLSKILAAQVRQEDTVAQLAPNQFAILSPSIGVEHCCSFALRIQQSIDRMVMTYREERIRIRVSVGVANAREDGMESVSNLIGLATRRARAGAEAGGGKVMTLRGEVSQKVEVKLMPVGEREPSTQAAVLATFEERSTPSVQAASVPVEAVEPAEPAVQVAPPAPAPAAAHAPRSRREIPDALMSELPMFTPAPAPAPVRRTVVSLDQCLELLRADGADALVPDLDAIISRVLPLLDLIESQLGVGLPVEALRRHVTATLNRNT